LDSDSTLASFAVLVSLLLTAAEPPSRWSIGLAALRSRLNAAIVGGIGGAKLYYVGLTGWDPRSILSGAGLAWYGGLMGGVAAVTVLLMRVPREDKPHGGPISEVPTRPIIAASQQVGQGGIA